LAVLTALVSVLGVAGPTIKEVLFGHDSRIHLSFVDSSSYGDKIELTLLARNDGSRPGSVMGDGSILLFSPRISDEWRRGMDPADPLLHGEYAWFGADHRLRVGLYGAIHHLKDGDPMEPIKFIVPLRIPIEKLALKEEIPVRFNRASCGIELRVVNFAGSEDHQSVPVSCGKIWKAFAIDADIIGASSDPAEAGWDPK
jgi:hypothetical protein